MAITTNPYVSNPWQVYEYSPQLEQEMQRIREDIRRGYISATEGEARLQHARRSAESLARQQMGAIGFYDEQAKAMGLANGVGQSAPKEKPSSKMQYNKVLLLLS